MTDVLSIDYEVDGFIKNNLDWRKFRENYNRVSATKVKRGIKPLPFPLLLKLFGPQKVFNTFVIARQNGTDNPVEWMPATDQQHTEEMPHGDLAVTSTVEFPGKAVVLNPSNEERRNSLLKGTKQLKRDALPVRPAFQRNSRVPGRYFPKPSSTLDESYNAGLVEGSGRDRTRTQTPRSVQSLASGSSSTRGSTVHPSKRHRTPRLVRGPTCKPTDTVSLQNGRYPPWSGKSSATTLKSTPTTDQNGFLSTRKTLFNGESLQDTRSDYDFSLRSEDRSLTFSNADMNSHPECKHDIFTSIRVKHSARQVSFPKTCSDFSAVLQGRSKTLHRRDPGESMDLMREPRARTHVGFAGIDS